MPKVSVLMPVYKTDITYLRNAIESVLNQTYTDFEFLLLDDCPTDTRENIINSYKDKRIKYIKNEKNLGITPSRNKLIDMAKGEYLAIMDHDDISLPKRFEKQVQYLDAHPDIGVVGCKTKIIDIKQKYEYPSNDKEIKLNFMYRCPIFHSSCMIRKNILTKNNIYYEEDFSPAEDYAIFCRLIPFTKFHNINEETLFIYRNHRTNTSHKQKRKMQNATYAIQAFTRFNNPELYEEYKLRLQQIKELRLFGIIPFLKTIKKDNKTKIYLFNKILLCKIKIRIIF